MPKIQISAKGIKAALKKYTPYQSIVEYVWNGFDAQATQIQIDYVYNELGAVETITISDNGYGIPHSKLQEKFEAVFESKKALENKLKKNQSAIHGKNGIGRLTFFTFARNAAWNTVYAENEQHWNYDIYANAENINLYTGINAIPKSTQQPTGTRVSFHSVHGLERFQMEEKFKEYLLREFAWFLALNSKRNFSIAINGEPLDWQQAIADSEQSELLHEETQTHFLVRYIRWNQKPNIEPSRYYYLDSENKEKWKEPTTVRHKGEKFYHSIFIHSSYFDNFSFQTDSQENQLALADIGGTRTDSQFRFLRKKLANLLRIRRRPFLKGFAEQLFDEYAQKNILPESKNPNLEQTIKTLYEMQPRIFSALNIEQKKLLIGLLNISLENKNQNLISLFSSVIELSESEKIELMKLCSSSEHSDM